MPITHVMKQHAQVAVSDEAKIYEQNVDQGK